MKFKNTALKAAMALALGTIVTTTHGALPDGTTLSIDLGAVIPGDVICTHDTTDTGGTCYSTTLSPTGLEGSYFFMGAGKFGITLVEGFDGIKLGIGQPRGTGSHGGSCTGNDTGAITAPWGFFLQCGHEFGAGTGIVASTATSDPNSLDLSAAGQTLGLPHPSVDGHEFLDFNNWRVTWNSIPEINMGGGLQDCGTDDDGICAQGSGTDFTDISGTFFNGSSLAHLACFSDAARTASVSPCAPGHFYRSEYAAIVPQADPSNFGGVLYELHLEGKIIGAGDVIAAADSVVTTLGETTTVPVLDNDEPPAELDPASVTVTGGPTTGAAVANADGTIDYTAGTANPDAVGTDTFTYSVARTDNPSATDTATVSVDVQVNVAPIAGDVSTSPTAGTTIVINVLDSVSDANGNVDPATVEIVTPPGGGGSAVVIEGGLIQYTTPNFTGLDSFTYRVSDTGVPSKLSNTATVNVTITNLVCDGGSLSHDDLNILSFEAGVPGDPDNTRVPPLSGSFFTMQLDPTTLIHTTLAPGPGGGVVLEYDQISSGSHSGPPDSETFDERPNLDEPWPFFGNTGLHFTTNGGIRILDSGCLGFSDQSDPDSQGYWIVTWNAIPVIDQGGCKKGTNCPENVEDLGIAALACDPAPCADGSHFQLEYAAHVPVGDPSGFGGVPYTLFLNGTLVSLPGALTSSNGTLGPGALGEVRVTAEDVPSETETDDDGNLLVPTQCWGGCFDYEISGVTTSSVRIVIPLAETIPADARYRVYKNGAWQDFDTSTGDSIQSAPYAPGDGACPTGGGIYVSGLVEGNRCLLITKSDNGPNDTNPAVGVIADPSGVGISKVPPPPPPIRGTSDSGCTVSGVAVDPRQRGDWWLLAGLLAWWGWGRRRKQA